jgi:DNA replication protein
VQRGTILDIACERDGHAEKVYFLNTEADRQVISRLKKGEVSLTGLSVSPAEDRLEKAPESRPDIFTLYEENIGLLTPLISDELRDAEKEYPPEWIYGAIKEAVTANKRNWRYINRILERWRSEGKDNGTYSGDSAAGHDPDKYIRGKYGHMVQR